MSEIYQRGVENQGNIAFIYALINGGGNISKGRGKLMENCIYLRIN